MVRDWKHTQDVVCWPLSFHIRGNKHGVPLRLLALDVAQLEAVGEGHAPSGQRDEQQPAFCGLGSGL